jgi:transcriptional regulator with XRE-family HTH domain
MGFKSQAKNPLVQLIIKKANEKGFVRQNELAEAVGVSTSVISRVFAGRGASLDNLFKLLDYFNLINTESIRDLEISMLYKELADERKQHHKSRDKLDDCLKMLKKNKRKKDPPDLNVLKMRRKK